MPTGTSGDRVTGLSRAPGARGCGAPWRQVQQRLQPEAVLMAHRGPRKGGTLPWARRGTVHRPGAPPRPLSSWVL